MLLHFAGPPRPLSAPMAEGFPQRVCVEFRSLDQALRMGSKPGVQGFGTCAFHAQMIHDQPPRLHRRGG